MISDLEHLIFASLVLWALYVASFANSRYFVVFSSISFDILQLPLKLGRLRILNPSLQQSALQLNYSSKQRLPFVYYNRVQLYNASNSGRLADRIAERTAQK